MFEWAAVRHSDMTVRLLRTNCYECCCCAVRLVDSVQSRASSLRVLLALWVSQLVRNDNSGNIPLNPYIKGKNQTKKK